MAQSLGREALSMGKTHLQKLPPYPYVLPGGLGTVPEARRSNGPDRNTESESPRASSKRANRRSDS